MTFFSHRFWRVIFFSCRLLTSPSDTQLKLIFFHEIQKNNFSRVSSGAVRPLMTPLIFTQFILSIVIVLCKTLFSDLSLTNITNGPRQRRSTANSQASVSMPVALPPKTRQRNPSGNVQDIYLNRLWRSQMPKEKALESIAELPTSEQRGVKVTKRVRCLKFDDVPTKTKLRQRRQMAVKNGWKPLTKKQHALLDSRLSDKLAELERDLM